MLNINTQLGQSIFIGDKHTLTLNSYTDDELNLTLVNNDDPSDSVTFTLGACEDMWIVPHVVLHYIGNGSSGVRYAILGFDAPRHIRIKGEWQNFNSEPGPANRTKLRKMTDKSLMYYANMNAKTALEHELLSRLTVAIVR